MEEDKKLEGEKGASRVEPQVGAPVPVPVPVPSSAPAQPSVSTIQVESPDEVAMEEDKKLEGIKGASRVEH